MIHKYVAMVLATIPAWAGTITVGSNDVSRGAYVDFGENGNRVNDFAGVIRAAFDYGSLLDFLSADPYKHIPQGTYYSNVFGAPAGTGLSRVAWLYDYQLISAISPTSGAGLQLAIWDIIADGGDGSAAGYIRATTGTPQAVVDSWLHYLTVSAGQMSTYADFYKNHTIEGVYVETLVGPGRPVPPPVVNPPSDGDDGTPPGEDVIDPPPGNLNEVPEPSTISMFVVSALAIGLLKLRK
jgi:hypothetical protein